MKDLNFQTKKWAAAVIALHPFPSLSFPAWQQPQLPQCKAMDTHCRKHSPFEWEDKGSISSTVTCPQPPLLQGEQWHDHHNVTPVLASLSLTFLAVQHGILQGASSPSLALHGALAWANATASICLVFASHFFLPKRGLGGRDLLSTGNVAAGHSHLSRTRLLKKTRRHRKLESLPQLHTQGLQGLGPKV